MRFGSAVAKPLAGLFGSVFLLACAFALSAGHAPAAGTAGAAGIGQPQITSLRASFPRGEPAPPKITAKGAILIDADSGEILYSRNANAHLPMASTTKIMTAILVLEALDPREKVRVSAGAVSTIGSVAGLAPGEELTVEELLNALLVVSGNDAANVLAEKVAGSVSAFVAKMNARAKAMGLTNTHFVNASGLNKPNHYSSARDLATMASLAMKNSLFRRIVDREGYCLPTLPGQQPRRFQSSDKLLLKFDWVTGIKTGSTSAAGYCVVSSGTIDGVSLIAVILGAADSDTRWNEARDLLEYGFSLYPRMVLVDKGEWFGKLGLDDNLGRSVDIVAEKAFTTRLARADVVTRSIYFVRQPLLPVSGGEIVGAIEFTLGNRTIGLVNLVTAQPVATPTLAMLLDYWRAQSPVRFSPYLR